MKSPLLFLTLTATAFTATAHAGVRDSAGFSLTTETGVPGQPRAKSPRFTCDSAADGMAGISQTSGASGSPVLAVKFGYDAQLYDAVGLTLVASPNPAPESSFTQLTAAAAADDGTGLSLSGAASDWTILSGPLSAITGSGRATTTAVRREEQATARATVAGQIVTGLFTVMDNLPDNFGPVAADGLADRWQFHYFDANDDGILENPALATPGADPDHDGLTNFEEAAFGLLPQSFSASPLTVSRDPDDGSLLLWWTRPVDTLGIIVEPQWSLDLNQWYLSGTGQAGETARTYHQLLLSTGPGPDGAPLQLWHALLAPADGTPRLFGRLSVR